MKRALIFASLAIVSIQGVAQSSADLLDQWRQTLRYGIDSEVADLVTRLREFGERRLDEELARRFAVSRSDTLRASIIRYFSNLDSPLIAEQVRSIVLGDDIPAAVIEPAVSYLSTIVAARDTELLDRYRQLARTQPLLPASVAIEAIGVHGGDEASMVLLDLYPVVDEDLKPAVLRALGRAGSPLGVELLTLIATDEFERGALRHDAAGSLGRIGLPESQDVLISLLESPDSVLRAYAVQALGYYRTGRAATVLTESLLDSFWRVRVAALHGLAESPLPDAVEAIAYKARRDPERPVREAAIRTLAATGTAAAFDVLDQVARDSMAGVTERSLAVQMLVDRRGEASLETLEQVVESEWRIEGSRLLDSVGRLVSESATAAYEPLIARLLEHPNYIIRIYGIRAVARAGLEDRIPDLTRIAQEAPAGILQTAAVTALSHLGVEFSPAASEEKGEPAGNGAEP